MSRRVSVVVWFDAKTDPPTGDRSVLVHDQLTGFTAAGRFYGGDVEKLGITHWAERPVVSDLTDEDVLNAAHALVLQGSWSVIGHVQHAEAAGRLRAALGGEKGET